ncbi:MAG: hypothetical protein JNK48_08330, partial [Bryobacterales bacterium]|nr:hypothetical protein [Bryobacterales bacterium]
MRYAPAFLCTLFLIIPPATAQILTRQFGTSSIDTATSIAVTDSAIYIAGTSEGTFPGETNSGGLEPFLRKHDKSGAPIWTRQFGTAVEDRAQSVAADDTGVYVAGYTDGILPGQVPLGQRDAFLRKYDANGNILWTRQFGSSAYDYAEAVATNSTGVYVAGWTLGSLPGEVASGLGDAYIRKYDTLGNILWTRQYSAPGGQTFALKLSLDASGIYVGGTALGTFPGTDAKTYDHDSYVRKYSANGDHLWTRQSSANGDETAAIAADGTGVYLAGTITDSSITPPLVLSFLHRYTSNGAFLWSRYIAETGQYIVTSEVDRIVTAAADTTGVYLGGWNTHQAFTYKYDRNGTFLWTKPISAFPSVVATGVAINANSLFVTGFTAGALPGQTNSGSLDAFLLQFDTAPSPLRFVPLQPCRAVDTRIGQGFAGAYGPPFLSPNQPRTIPLRLSPCALPSHATAFAINATVVPAEPLAYLTIWPDRDPRPL